MAFVYRGSLLASAGRTEDREYIIGNSETLAIGEFVGFTTGYIQRVGAGADIFGLCVGFVVNDGTIIERADSSDFDGTYTASTQTYISTSDNQTDKKVRARVLVDPFGIYSGPADAALGTTTGSDLPGYYSNVVAASGTVDEDTSTTGTAQLLHLQKDPANSAQMLYVINESAIQIKS